MTGSPPFFVGFSFDFVELSRVFLTTSLRSYISPSFQEGEPLSFDSSKESSQRKDDPDSAPTTCCVAAGSGYPALLVSAGSPSRRLPAPGRLKWRPCHLPPLHLRCSALHTGMKSGCPHTILPCAAPSTGAGRWGNPHGRGLRGPAAGRRVTPTRLEVRSGGNPGRIAQQAGWGASQGRLFFGDFLLAAQKKVTLLPEREEKYSGVADRKIRAPLLPTGSHLHRRNNSACRQEDKSPITAQVSNLPGG